ncbi:MAG: hypothetical protein M0T84_13470 [Betaproteobacteria bacterium]|nr:hypothetical protein [Betaproteobacteria bacterium]
MVNISPGSAKVAENLLGQIEEAIPVLGPFVSPCQLKLMTNAAHGDGEEGEAMMRLIVDMANRIKGAGRTDRQGVENEEAIVTLHYFLGRADWYIIEKGKDGRAEPAYGFAVLNGDIGMAECGYISIEDLTRKGAVLDLHFTPCTLREVRAKHELLRAGY